MSVLNRDVRVARRGLRKDKRRRAPVRRKRRNLVKFIPTGDSDFAMTARNFVIYLQKHGEACGVPPERVAELDQAVTSFRGCLTATLLTWNRNKAEVHRKNAARRVAVEAVQTVADVIRADRNVDALHKTMLRIKVKPKKLKQRNCPVRPPMLQFIGSADGSVGGNGMRGGGSGVHIIKFFDLETLGTVRRAKPDGAARLELFIDYVPEGAPIPSHPAQQRGWHNYVQSYTKSPMRVEFPVPGAGSGAMLIVYWGRWADATGAVGRFSKTCVARVEGWSSSPIARAALEAEQDAALPHVMDARQIETKFVLIQAPLQLADGRLEEAEALRSLPSPDDR
jgi:hypothetical protein